MNLFQKTSDFFQTKKFRQRAYSSIILVLISIPAVIFLDAWPFRIILAFALCMSSAEVFTAGQWLSWGKHTGLLLSAEQLVLGVSVIYLLFAAPPAYYLILLIIAAFAYDIFAYIIGSLIGFRFFHECPIPRISKNKSIEGSIGGLIASFSLSHIYLVALGIVPSTTELIIATFGGGILAMLGDLLGSVVKRSLQIKDSNEVAKTLPFLRQAERLMDGHGGFLDRFDSLALVMFFSGVLFYFLGP